MHVARSRVTPSRHWGGQARRRDVEALGRDGSKLFECSEESFVGSVFWVCGLGVKGRFAGSRHEMG